MEGQAAEVVLAAAVLAAAVLAAAADLAKSNYLSAATVQNISIRYLSF